jgi:3D (Asp-Asp-Asp) domain-containing protein
MKLLQIIKEEIVPLSSKQHVVLLIIIACLFQFVLFYAPALADEAVKQANIKTNILKTATSSQDDLITTDSITQDALVTTDSIIKDQTMDQGAAKLAAPVASSTPEVSTSSPQTTTSTPQKVIKSLSRVITAYNSEAAQTDDDPCTTANGFNLCKHNEEDSIAANFLPFGTEVKIPELFGDRVFVVRDRMNSRFGNRVDVWMKDHGQALSFGVKVATIQVLE